MLPVEYPYGGPVGSNGWGPNSSSRALVSCPKKGFVWYARNNGHTLSLAIRSVSAFARCASLSIALGQFIFDRWNSSITESSRKVRLQ